MPSGSIPHRPGGHSASDDELSCAHLPFLKTQALAPNKQTGGADLAHFSGNRTLGDRTD